MCLVTQSSEEGIVSPGTGITDGCEPPRSCWEVNPGPLYEQQALLNDEPSLQPQPLDFFLLIL